MESERIISSLSLKLISVLLVPEELYCQQNQGFLRREAFHEVPRDTLDDLHITLSKTAKKSFHNATPFNTGQHLGVQSTLDIPVQFLNEINNFCLNAITLRNCSHLIIIKGIEFSLEKY